LTTVVAALHGEVKPAVAAWRHAVSFAIIASQHKPLRISPGGATFCAVMPIEAPRIQESSAPRSSQRQRRENREAGAKSQ
jgi:hypothetical protein